MAVRMVDIARKVGVSRQAVSAVLNHPESCRISSKVQEEIRRIAVDAIDISLRRSGRDWFEIKNTVKDDITKFLYARTGRRPMVLPIIMDV